MSKCRWGLKEGASSPSRNTVCLLCCGAPMKCNDLRKRSTFCKGRHCRLSRCVTCPQPLLRRRTA